MINLGGKSVIVRMEIKSKEDLKKYINSIQARKTVIFENLSLKELEDLCRKKEIGIDTRVRVLIISG